MNRQRPHSPPQEDPSAAVSTGGRPAAAEDRPGRAPWTDGPLRLLTQSAGFFTRLEALDAGLADRDLSRMVRARVLTRFRRGFYAFADEWSSLDEVGRHRVRSRAVVRSLGDAVVLSHVSAVVAHGIDVWGVPLDRVHVTRLDGAVGRIEGDVVHHQVGVSTPTSRSSTVCW